MALRNPPKLPAKPPQKTSHFTVAPHTRKKIPRAANTSLGKFFRLVLIEKDYQGLKKIYEENGFSGKAPTGRHTVLNTQ